MTACECGCGEIVPPTTSNNRIPRRYVDASHRAQAQRNRAFEAGRTAGRLEALRESLPQGSGPPLLEAVADELERARALLASALAAITGSPRAL